MSYPKKFKDLIESFESLPGIGPKTAERLAFFAIDKKNKDISKNLSNTILVALDSIRECSVCGMICDQDKCEICSDTSRENKLMIVESSKNVITFEKIGVYKGKYHVLNGLISPSNGIGPEDINIDVLTKRIIDEKISEAIIATGSNIDGELTALYLKKVFDKYGVKSYRIGYGLPASADIEYVDELTLIKSLESRKEM